MNEFGKQTEGGQGGAGKNKFIINIRGVLTVVVVGAVAWTADEVQIEYAVSLFNLAKVLLGN